MKKRIFGFTMIEIIITVIVIGGLATLAIVKYPASVQRARDVQRQNDLKNYQNALELYAMKNGGLYPTSGYIPIPTLCPVLGMTGEYCKNDPRGGNYNYETNSSGTSYTTWGSMEKTTSSFVVCSGGKNGLAAVTPAAGICPVFEITGYPTSAPPAASSTPAPTSTTAPYPSSTPTPRLTNTPTPTVRLTNTPTPRPTNTPTPRPTNTPTPTTSLPAVVYMNVATGKSCSTYCTEHGKSCIDVGSDPSGTNNEVAIYNTSTGFCQTPATGTCSTVLVNQSHVCFGYSAGWTYCRCQ